MRQIGPMRIVKRGEGGCGVLGFSLRWCQGFGRCPLLLLSALHSNSNSLLLMLACDLPCQNQHGTETEGLALPMVPVKMDSQILFRKFAYTGLPAGRCALPGSLLPSCKPSSQCYICKTVFIFTSLQYSLENVLVKTFTSCTKMVKAPASHCSTLGSCWSFPVPLTCPLLLAQNIRRSILLKQQLGTNILCLYSMFQ